MKFKNNISSCILSLSIDGFSPVRNDRKVQNMMTKFGAGTTVGLIRFSNLKFSRKGDFRFLLDVIIAIITTFLLKESSLFRHQHDPFRIILKAWNRHRCCRHAH
jgi:hypothetical protein